MAAALHCSSCLCAVLVLSLVAANGSCLAGPVGDSTGLVQQALTVTSLNSKPESEEDKLAAHTTKKHITEMVSKVLGGVKGMNPLVVLSAEPMMVNMLMDLRKKADPSARRLLDGVLALDLPKRNQSDPKDVGEVLTGLSAVFMAVDNAELAYQLSNASILVPPLMNAGPRVSALAEEALRNLTVTVEPLLKTLEKEIQPHKDKLEAKLSVAFNQTLTDAEPHVKALASTVSGAVNATLKHANTWFQDPQFAGLRSAIKSLTGTDI